MKHQMYFNIKKKNYRKIGVYQIRNKINGKIYVGSTTTNFRHRFLQYKSGFLRKLDNQPVLYRALRKYGIENFSFEIVAIVKKKNVLQKEQYYIDQGVDYNCAMIAGSLLGLKHASSSKTRTVNKGKHHCAKKIDQFTMNGEFIKTFDSIIECCLSVNKGKKSASHISGVCVGRTISAFNYKWAFSGNGLLIREDKRLLEQNKEARRQSQYKKIQSACLRTKEILVFNSIKEASLSTGIGVTSISNQLHFRSKKSYSKIMNKYLTFKLI